MQPGDSPSRGWPDGGRGSVRPNDPAGAEQRAEGDAGAPTLLSLAEAARAVGTTVQALWLRVQRGELRIHRVHENGRSATAVALSDILRLYLHHAPGPSPHAFAPAPPPADPAWGEHPAAPLEGSPPSAWSPPAGEGHGESEGAHGTYEVPRPAPPEPVSRQDAEALRAELERERVLRAQLEGKVESLREMEASARRYAERLESRLEQSEQELSEAKREALTLARALGQAEGRVLQLSAGRSEGGAGADAPRKRRRRRWWRRGR